MTIEIYIARHGLTLENLRQIVQGQLPGRLTRKGKRQAKALGNLLRNIEFDKVDSSDLDRAKQTAKIILARLVYKPALVGYATELRERGFGDMEGITYEEAGIADIPAEEMYAIDQEGIFQCIESLDSVRRRVKRVKKNILELGIPKTLVIAHEWLNSYLMNELLDEEISRETFHPQPNCACSYFKLNDENGKVLEYKIRKYEISN